MAWQGIPFIFTTHAQDLSLSVSNLPKLFIETPFSWEAVISALIAGALPSLIAIYALRSNYKIVSLQNKLMEAKDFKEKFRAATAEHVSDVILFVSAFQQWKANGHKDFDKVKSGWIPDEIADSMKLAERSKNHLMMLIDPEKGADLLAVIADMQAKMQDYIKTFDDGAKKRAFNESANNLLFESHLFLKSF